MPLGCRPGRITAQLRDLEVDAFGVDAYPGLRFEPREQERFGRGHLLLRRQ
jgi:hypothetical protein